MAIKRRRSRRHTKLTDWQRFHLGLRHSSDERYGEILKTFVCFHSREHRRAVYEANREELDAPQPDLPGARGTCFWEYTFPEVYEENSHLDKDRVVKLDDDGDAHPYQEDEPSVLKAFGLLTAGEELALRRKFPRGDEWGCPRFLLRDKREPEMR